MSISSENENDVIQEEVGSDDDEKIKEEEERIKKLEQDKKTFMSSIKQTSRLNTNIKFDNIESKINTLLENAEKYAMFLLHRHKRTQEQKQKALTQQRGKHRQVINESSEEEDLDDAPTVFFQYKINHFYFSFLSFINKHYSYNQQNQCYLNKIQFQIDVLLKIFIQFQILIQKNKIKQINYQILYYKYDWSIRLGPFVQHKKRTRNSRRYNPNQRQQPLLRYLKNEEISKISGQTSPVSFS